MARRCSRRDRARRRARQAYPAGARCAARSSQRTAKGARRPRVALSAEVIAAIGERLTARAGLALPAWVVEARASARIAAVGCSAAEYVALIDSARGAGELAALIETVRVG